MPRVPPWPRGYKPPPRPQAFDPWLAIDIALREINQQQPQDWPPPPSAISRAPAATTQAQPTPSEPEIVDAQEREPEHERRPEQRHVELSPEDRRNFELLNGIGSLLREEFQQAKEDDQARHSRRDPMIDFSQRLDQLGRQYEDLRSFLGAPRRIV